MWDCTSKMESPSQSVVFSSLYYYSVVVLCVKKTQTKRECSVLTETMWSELGSPPLINHSCLGGSPDIKCCPHWPWPFVVTSPMHTCVQIMLFNQPLGMPHLSGGSIILAKVILKDLNKFVHQIWVTSLIFVCTEKVLHLFISTFEKWERKHKSVLFKATRVVSILSNFEQG